MKKTTLIRSLRQIAPEHRGCVMTIGNFDGVHGGHQRLIAQVIAEAKARNCPSLILTFEPHPFEFFAHNQNNHNTHNTPNTHNKENQFKLARLTRLREKFTALAKTGIDYVLTLPFNRDVANMTASHFVAEILYHTLACKHIIVGDDFRFGYKRQGDVLFLGRLGKQYGFNVEVLPTIHENQQRISSTRVREALNQADLSEAAKLLGRPYTMQGRISHGDKLGRELGFPTANIFLHRQLTPFTGVFTVLVYGITDYPLPGVANIGIRPTLEQNTRTLLEVHLLDFDQTIYGRYVEIEFCQKLREEIRYPNLDLLKNQIADDVAQAKAYFATATISAVSS